MAKWNTDVHHYSKVDDLWRRFEILKRGVFSHLENLGCRHVWLKRFCSDSARKVPLTPTDGLLVRHADQVINFPLTVPYEELHSAGLIRRQNSMCNFHVPQFGVILVHGNP